MLVGKSILVVGFQNEEHEEHMDTNQIISELEAERTRLDEAISALRGLGSGGNGRRGRKPGRRGRRHLSAAAKKRISEMMKKRWAERKRAAKAA